MHMRTAWQGRAGSAALILILTGCASVSAYRAPHVELAPFQAAHANASAKPAAPVDTYWTAFHDPILARVVERALEGNLDLRIARTHLAEASAAARAAGALRLPAVDLEASTDSMRQSRLSPIGRLASARPGYNPHATDAAAGVAATWELDLGGGLASGEAAATAEAQAVWADGRALHVLVAAEAARAYFRVRDVQMRIDFLARRIGIAERQRGLVQRQRAAGAASSTDVAHAQADLDDARASLPVLRAALRAQSNRLDVLAGAQPGTYAGELATPAALPDTPGVPLLLTAEEVLRGRPDVIAAERRLAAAHAGVGVATAAYYPRLSIGGLLGVEALGTGLHPAGLFSAAAFQPQLLTGLRWRLFDFGRVDAEVAQARGREEARLAAFRKTLFTAAENVEDAFSALAELELQAQYVRQEAATLATVRTSAETAYRRGAGSLVEVLAAERQLLAVEERSAMLRFDAAGAAVDCFKAVGGIGSARP